jgi:hypothetical protein
MQSYNHTTLPTLYLCEVVCKLSQVGALLGVPAAAAAALLSLWQLKPISDGAQAHI